MVKFEVGKTYSTRSIGDHNCIISVTIAKRTAKTVTTTDGKTFRPSEYEGVETLQPWGRYSMSPIVRANDTAELKRDWEVSKPEVIKPRCDQGGPRHVYLSARACTLCGNIAPSFMF